MSRNKKLQIVDEDINKNEMYIYTFMKFTTLILISYYFCQIIFIKYNLLIIHKIFLGGAWIYIFIRYLQNIITGIKKII